MSWNTNETRNYVFEGAGEENSKYTVTLGAGIYEVEVHGSNGGDDTSSSSLPFRNGGTGGYIKGKYSTNKSEELEIWIGERGKNGKEGIEGTGGSGGWGRFSGGSGGGGWGGGGGGSTELIIDGSVLAIADGGGGAAGLDGGRGGGGGARCGSGGDVGSYGNNGISAECDSATTSDPWGGDGGGGERFVSSDDGEDGGQEAGEDLYDTTETTGGATEDGEGNGYVKITCIESSTTPTVGTKYALPAFKRP
jgi:hypothetical protein